MANGFTKEDMVAWETMLEGFEDALVLSNNVSRYNTNATDMQRANDTIWRRQPYIAQSYSGADATSNFGNVTELAVPASIGYRRHSTAMLDALELRDLQQEGLLGTAAYQKLASDINQSIMTVAANSGTLVVKRTVAATGFDDVALCEAVMNEQGVNGYDRYLALTTRDYNGMAANLASRTLDNSKSLTAYDKAYVGEIASFKTFKLDYANTLTAAAGVTVKINGANQYYTPKATSTATTGEQSPVDNRYQNVTISVTSGTVAVGDCFTIAGVNAVHHITKGDTGQLKTFRVTGIVSGAGGSGVVTISPPIISAGGATDAEKQYQNVTATPADQAVVTFLNTVTKQVNPFWQKDALEILPAKLAIDTTGGVSVMKGSTSNGIEIVMQKQYDINLSKYKYRWDVLYGVVNKQPEMTGIMLFSQS